MKKISRGFVMMVLIMVIGLTGCASNNNSITTTSAKEDTKEEKKEGSVDLSEVTLRFGQTGWGQIEESLKAAGLEDTPYKVEYSVFQGGNLILEAMTQVTLILELRVKFLLYFSSLSQNGDNSKVIAVQQSNTLNQELVVAKDSDIKSVEI